MFESINAQFRDFSTGITSFLLRKIRLPLKQKKHTNQFCGVFNDDDELESNDQELIQSDPTSCPQNQKGNN